MANPLNLEDIYDRLLTINEEAFNAGYFDVAYYALMSALHCAEFMETDEPLLKVNHIAKKQIAWIDQNHPDYHHSTRSASKRHQPMSIFSTLASQAGMMIKMRRTNDIHGTK